VTPEDVARHAEMLGNRVAKNQRRLAKRFDRENIGAYRLFDRDIPEVRAVVDWYEGHLVVAEYARTQTLDHPEWLEAMGASAARALSVPSDHVHLKRRVTRPQAGLRYDKLDAKGARVSVREGPLRFWVNLDDYLDTGLFSDHRKTRAMIGQQSDGKRVLNLFGYTGAFTCAAAHGGAASTVTVDRSNTYLAWTQDNLQLNRLASDRHQTIKRDVAVFLDESRGGFDIAIVDPPSYSTASEYGPGFDVVRDHRELIEDTLRLVRRGGTLYFSTNHQAFEPAFYGLEATEITARTVPEDYRNRQAHRCWTISSS